MTNLLLFQAHKLITDWGLDIAAQTVPLVARVLSPETLFFGRGKKELIGIRTCSSHVFTNSVTTNLRKTNPISLFVLIVLNGLFDE